MFLDLILNTSTTPEIWNITVPISTLETIIQWTLETFKFEIISGSGLDSHTFSELLLPQIQSETTPIESLQQLQQQRRKALIQEKSEENEENEFFTTQSENENLNPSCWFLRFLQWTLVILMNRPDFVSHTLNTSLGKEGTESLLGFFLSWSKMNSFSLPHYRFKILTLLNANLIIVVKKFLEMDPTGENKQCLIVAKMLLPEFLQYLSHPSDLISTNYLNKEGVSNPSSIHEEWICRALNLLLREVFFGKISTFQAFLQESILESTNEEMLRFCQKQLQKLKTN